MILEIINPSDAVCLEADDISMAGVAVMMLSSAYGLKNEQGEIVLPLMIFGGQDKWLKEHEVNDIDAYLKENRTKLADIFESVFYGHLQDKASFNSTISKMTPERAKQYKKEWNEKRRSSLTNIEQYCLDYAKALRQNGGKE